MAHGTPIRDRLQNAIRPSRSDSTPVLWARSLLNAVLFFGVFMLALPALAHWVLPVSLPVSSGRTWVALPAVAVAAAAIVVWIVCLDAFVRRGRGTPLPADAPRHLVTTGPFAVVRNPIMAAELSFIWAEALYTTSLGIVLYALILSATAQLSLLYIEEPELRARFGAKFDAYCERVPRWLPRFGRL